MTAILKQDLDQLNILLEEVKKQSINYLKQLNERKTTVTVANSYEYTGLDNVGLGWRNALEKFNTYFEPLVVASSGSRYLGFVTGGTTPASIAGDWLTTVYDQNTQSTNGQGDVSAIIEQQTIRLLRDLLALPEDFDGGFVTGATMSNFTCLAVARQWLGKNRGKDFAKDGIDGKIPILSATPHSSIVKSLAMLGIGSNNIEKIEVVSQEREAMAISDLISRVQGLEGQPFILVTSAGTVNTADYDNFNAIAELKKKYDFWWHIDGAFGAMVACSPTYCHLLDGWQFADSITVDCHKWLNVPYENAVFFVKNTHHDLQVETFQNTNAPYLGTESIPFNYLNFLPENSRRFKALPVWFTLTAYGKDGYRSIVENSISIAKKLSHYIEQNENFELLAVTRLNNVCFTLKDSDKSSDFLYRLNSQGKVFMTPTILNGRKGIRASFVNWRTNENDLKIIISEMEGVFKKKE